MGGDAHVISKPKSASTDGAWLRFELNGPNGLSGCRTTLQLWTYELLITIAQSSLHEITHPEKTGMSIESHSEEFKGLYLTHLMGCTAQ